MIDSFFKKFPWYGWIGFLLVISFWYLNWNLEGLRTHILFFPLWVGYVLTIDGLVYYKKSSSLINRSKTKFTQLFLISAPAWWLFELLNLRTQNWLYDGKQFFSEWEYAIYATISFSTVLPAVFGTAELVSTFNWTEKFKMNKPVKINESTLAKLFLTGIMMLGLIILLPENFYYLEWVAVYLILEPVNYKLKNRTLLEYLKKGNWQPVIALSAGALVCGFFWELWNYYSYPKWIYDVPFVDFLHIFEMPLIGYLGYIPFSLELFALYHLVMGFTKHKKDVYILTIDN